MHRRPSRRTTLCVRLAAAFILALVAPAAAAWPVATWQRDIDHPPPAGITTLRLTPDGTTLVVFHFTDSEACWVEGLDVVDGHELWSRKVTLPNYAVATTGWVDAAGHIYLASRQRTVWRYGPDVSVQQWSYSRLRLAFEWVNNVITDEAFNVYASGCNKTFDGVGSMAVKISSTGAPLWSVMYTASFTGKDNYGCGVGLDSAGNLYRGGADQEDTVAMRGRVLGHRSADGAVFLNYSLELPNSAVYGLGVDAWDRLVLGISYGLRQADGSPATGSEQSLIRLLTTSGLAMTPDFVFPDAGLVLVADTLTISADKLAWCVGYQRAQGGVSRPGVARFTMDGLLEWSQEIEAPGWQLAAGGVEMRGEDVYIGMNDKANPGVTRVVKLTAGSRPTDADGDGIPDETDNCPASSNRDQGDSDGDGLGDACDQCPHDAANDQDGDGVCGDVDNCREAFNRDQADSDGDGLGDACDACPHDAANDQDGDGVCGDVDNCREVFNRDQADSDGDGLGDPCDPCPRDAANDQDGDGLCADQDGCPQSDGSSALVIGGWETGVPNVAFSDGCTMVDQVSQLEASASTHGDFVAAVARLTTAWRRAGLITAVDKERIQSYAARARKR